MRYLIPFMLLLGGCRNPFSGPRLPSVSFPTVNVTDQVYDWATLYTYAGGLSVFFGIVAFCFIKEKSIAVRLLFMGFIFIMAGQTMEILGDYMEWILLLCLFAGVIFNAARVEKFLYNRGIEIDINRDGIYGTTRTGKKKSEPALEKNTDGDETAIIENKSIDMDGI